MMAGSLFFFFFLLKLRRIDGNVKENVDKGALLWWQ